MGKIPLPIQIPPTYSHSRHPRGDPFAHSSGPFLGAGRSLWGERERAIIITWCIYWFLYSGVIHCEPIQVALDCIVFCCIKQPVPVCTTARPQYTKTPPPHPPPPMTTLSLPQSCAVPTPEQSPKHLRPRASLNPPLPIFWPWQQNSCRQIPPPRPLGGKLPTPCASLDLVV